MMFVRKMVMILSIVGLCLGLSSSFTQQCAAAAEPVTGMTVDAEGLEFVHAAPSFVPIFAPNLTFIGMRGVVLSQFSNLNELVIHTSTEYSFVLIDLMLILIAGFYLGDRFIALVAAYDRWLRTKAEKTSLQS